MTAEIGYREDIRLSSDDEHYAMLFDPMACKATAPHIDSYTSCPASTMLQNKALAAAYTHGSNAILDKGSFVTYKWVNLHDQARKQATSELVEYGILKDEYAGARQLAILHKHGPLKGADGELSILIPTTQETRLIYLSGGSLGKGKWVCWSIHSILILKGGIIIWTDTAIDYMIISISIE